MAMFGQFVPKVKDIASRARQQTLGPMLDASAPAGASGIQAPAAPAVAPQPKIGVQPTRVAAPEMGMASGASGALGAPAPPPKFTGDWESELRAMWNSAPGSTPDDLRAVVRDANARGIPIKMARRMGGTMESNDKIIGPDGRTFDLIVDESGKNLRAFNEDLPEPGEMMGGTLDAGPSAASQDDSLLSSVLQQLQGQQGAPRAAVDPAQAVLNQRDALRSRARRAVLSEAL